MLEQFRQAKKAEIATLMALAAKGAMPRPFSGPRPCFTAMLRAKGFPAVIAEYKRASPSKGEINLSFSPEEAARAYAHAGAGALSVLTEQEYFKGDVAYLARMTEPGLPLLRKDFVLHPLQVDQTAASPASAVLLIVRMLDDPTLRALVFRCLDLGLEAVVEVCGEKDLWRARRIGASCILVNNRDLQTLRVDLATSRSLAAFKDRGEFWITASGITRHEELTDLLSFRFDAALIGSSLMGGVNPGQELAALLDCKAAPFFSSGETGAGQGGGEGGHG